MDFNSIVSLKMRLLIYDLRNPRHNLDMILTETERIKAVLKETV